MFVKPLKKTFKTFKMTPKKPLKLKGDSPKLTKKEQQVLTLLTTDFLTVKQVALRRHCSVQAVYEIKKRLEKKGVLSRTFKNLEKKRCTFKGFGVRLHGQEFNIKLLWQSPVYKRYVGKLLFFDGNSVRCYKNSVEVYGKKSFEAEDEHKATAESLVYWERFFSVLENDLKVLLVKPRKNNIELVKAHYAEVNSEMAREAEVSGEKIRIYARDDGKLWFMIDNSFNLFEAETQHRDTSKRDLGIVRKHLNDWRDNDPPTLSETMRVLDTFALLLREQAEVNKETAAGLNAVVKLLNIQNVENVEKVEKFKSNKNDDYKPDYFG